MAKNDLFVENGNVVLVDPNFVNINTDMTNAIPQYQDMYIFAELTAVSKGRTVIINGNATSTSSKKINFIGNNQNKDSNNPNYLNFTTNYYDGSNPDGEYYEGFGINNIKIVINSSFIPQVSIQFVDIRGLAFFNQQDSPYRILFDFPPPIFSLTVKGYYGKAITYQLHLVKYTSEFSAENGNFIIDAQFVAVTFAPLTDILFRYVVNAPLINNQESMQPETGFPPKNTFELIMKLRNLYASVADKLETDTENKELNSINKQLETITDIMSIFKSVISNENEVLNAKGTPYLVSKTPSAENNLVSLRPSETFNLRVLTSLAEFDYLIKNEETTGIKNSLKNRLYVVYVAGTNLPLTQDDYNPFENSPTYVTPLADPFVFPSANYSGFKTALTTFGDNLLNYNLPSFNILRTDVAKPEPFTSGKNIATNEISETQYYGMDVTEYYYKLYKKNQEYNENKEVLSNNVAEKINNMVAQNLGMTPSIYNIFKIILDDVDEFFSILRKISNRADAVHNNPASNKAIIASNNIDSPTSGANVPDHIYPFPLIIKEAPVYGGVKRERVAPIELSKQVEFPELELVSNFMDTFLLQRSVSKLYDARINQNDDGTYKWIPISPLDSVLGGASPESPYLNINDDVRAEISKIFLKRFYILSQGSVFNTFYDKPSNKRDAYINMYANSEAINIATTLVSPQNADTVKIMANDYKGNVDAFYRYVSGITDTYDNGSGLATNNLYSFPTNDPKYFPVTPSNPFEGQVYVNKNNPDFIGVNWYENEIVINDRSNNENSTNPVDNFNSEAKNGWFKQLFKGSPAEYEYYEFTEENVIYLRDIADTDDIRLNTIVDGLSTYTRYLTKYPTPNTQTTSFIVDYDSLGNPRYNSNYPSAAGVPTSGRQKLAYQEGNLGFDETGRRDKQKLKYGNNIINVWATQLAKHNIVDVITGDTKLAPVILLSNFGTTASPFNIYPNALNNLIFDTPAAVEVPAFYAPYLGVLLTAIDDTTVGTDNWLYKILNFFTGSTGMNGIGTTFPNWGFYVLADLHDVQNYLSANDREKFKQAYRDFESTVSTIIAEIKGMCQYVRENTGKNKWFSTEYEGIKYQLDPSEDKIKNALGLGSYFHLIQYMMERKALVNFSQITFEMKNLSSYPVGYSSIRTLNVDENKKNVNKSYFEKFFARLSQELGKEIKRLVEEEEELKKAKGDVDIINQLYYSFKNINDKWLTGNLNSNNYYPFNKPNKKLIDSFAFVDRAMNPIGDTILNAEVLVDMFNDPNLSLFTVLSQLLSLNGFEFFPLQNFMNFDKGGWVDSFKIHTGGVYDKTSTAFVCMYVGGSSSYPTVSDSGFENDGIIDISKPGVSDYSLPKLTPKEINELRMKDVNTLTEDEKQIVNNDSIPWREVRAFRVRFGEQNQSMFTDIKIDSKEYPETNESIQILSRLAGDNNPDAPVPKGQNLYNLYENRSYKATVTGLGNAMIQPTQYFQLENIPLFNGAYIILTVEHNITANRMMTSFSGTKLLRYPVPRVLNPMAFVNYFSTDQTPGNIVVAASTVSNRNETHYTAMYDNTPNSLKIE